ncbi:MAG: HAMP domain-containing histidine kinase [Clostridiales bacterium]|nr:HAMP domain-containing histidine kinase [Clostridiales bacterium]
MFKKTRIRIVAVIMLVLTVIFLGTLAIIFASSYIEGAKSNNEKMERYATLFSLESQPGSDIPDINEKPNDSNDKISNEPENEPEHFPDEESLSFQLTTFYSVALDDDGNALAIDTGQSQIYSKETLSSFAQSITDSGKSNGTNENLLYSTYDKDSYTLVVFMDNTLMSESFSTLFRYTLIFGSLALILIFFIAVYLARCIVKPLEKSYKIQKQFISDAGHELKTPVSVVSANLELLEREIGQNKWLDNVRYENEHMGILVGQLLELARTENVAVDFETVDLSRLVNGEALTLESVAFEKEIKLNTDIDDSLYVFGNTTQLKQLVTILIDNALQHSTVGKEISIALKEQHSNIKLSVINDGDEIPIEQRESLFDRFYRVDDSRNNIDNEKHYGLGLAIAKAIVTAHKGKISVLCYDGKIEFSVIIPIKK